MIEDLVRQAQQLTEKVTTADICKPAQPVLMSRRSRHNQNNQLTTCAWFLRRPWKSSVELSGIWESRGLLTRVYRRAAPRSGIITRRSDGPGVRDHCRLR